MKRIITGGSWRFVPLLDSHIANLAGIIPGFPDRDIGLRLVRRNG